MMLGACVPQECRYQEVADSVMPQFIQVLSGAFGVCGRADYPWTPFRIIAVLITVILVALVLTATAKEMVRLILIVLACLPCCCRIISMGPCICLM